MKLIMTAILFVSVLWSAPRAQPLYDDYASVLSKYVDKNGLVNYAELSARRQALTAFTVSLAAVDAEELDDWDKNDRMAFWINAYNALTLLLILDHYPIEQTSDDYPANSIQQIPGAFDKVKFQVAGKDYSLNNIENDILRKRFNEPRIHMALVCAAMSCPPLRRAPYLGADAGKQLDDQARRFVNIDTVIDGEAKVVNVSPLFDWFKDDFMMAYGGDDATKELAIITFLKRYIDEEHKSFIGGGKFKLGFHDYDWSLNEQK